MTQLGAQFAGQSYSQGGSILNLAQTVFTPNTRYDVTGGSAGPLRIGQTLYVVLEVQNLGTLGRQAWIMPWWLHPVPEYRYPGQGSYTASDLADFGAQVLPKAWQDSLWMTSPKRFDISGAPSPAGTSISDMQSDIWAVDVPALSTVKKSFFYPSHGYGLGLTLQAYNDGVPMDGIITCMATVIPGATHAVFQDGQG